MSNKKTIPSFTMQDTSNPNIKRFVDRNGDWTHYWIVDEKRFVPAVNHVLSLGYNKGPRFAEYLLSVSKEEARKKLTTAGEAGTRTHEAIRLIIEGSKITMETKLPNELTGRQEVLSSEEWDNLIGFDAFCEKYGIETVVQDHVIYSKEHGYAGTLDWFGLVSVPDDDKAFPKEVRGKKALALIDWKSSSGIWKEYGAQVAAYMVALIEEGMFRGYLSHYSDVLFTGVVRVGTRHKNGGYEVKAWNALDSGINFEKFKAAYRIAGDDLVFDADSVTQIPVEFSRKIPKAKEPVSESAKPKRARKPRAKKESKKLKDKN